MTIQRTGIYALAACILCAGLFGCARQQEQESSTFAMDTWVTQTTYGGSHAKEAMQEVNTALAAFEKRLSLFDGESDIARINGAAGSGMAVEVSAETAALLEKSVALSAGSERAFQITIAPLTLAWGVTTGQPRVVPQEEIDALLPLVDDSKLEIAGGKVLLPGGMALDLGGIAKGEACNVAAEIYGRHGVDSALLWIGGNTYARGTKPGGTPWRVGFRNPLEGGDAYLASFDLTDAVIAVSDGSERFFEADDETYIHIIDPRTGRPAVSDVLSVGAICEDGGEADFWSTTLFVWGVERTLEYMRAGGQAILLDYEGNLYVSAALRDTFELYEAVADDYPLTFIEGVG